MRTLRLAFLVLMAAGSGGCAIGFAGKRSVGVDLNILGSTLKWNSTVDGDYKQATRETDAGGEP